MGIRKRGWKSDLLASALSPSTVRKHLVFVAAAMNLAVAWGLVARNPLEHIEFPIEETPPFHVYTPAEQAALLSAAAPGEGDKDGHHRGRSDGSLFMPVVLDLATGLRRGELLGLRIRDVDVARNRIQVCQALRKSADGGLEMGRRQT
jgi:integrase